MEKSFDVIIVGLGVMGSATAYHLARRGVRVLGLERFWPPHWLGSSHGRSRIIREAYYEHPTYVPLVRRAYELWAEVESEAGRRLFLQTGGLTVGPAGSELVQGSLLSARSHGIAHEVLSADEVRRRFPALNPDPQMVAVWEERAGVLFPEMCVASLLGLARRHGAELKFGQEVTGWEADGLGVQVQTRMGTYRAARLVIAAGAWVTSLVPDLPIQVERQAMVWFQPRANPHHFRPGQLPVFILEYAPGKHFYGLPDLGAGVKTARHHGGETVDPDLVDREVREADIEALRELLRRYVPAADGPVLTAAVCLYTNAPDYHFIIDFHPAHPEVLILSPCSGHGFKFGPAVGEIAADLITTGQTRVDVGFFGLGRLGQVAG
jgi:sarcosine oxidase